MARYQYCFQMANKKSLEKNTSSNATNMAHDRLTCGVTCSDGFSYSNASLSQRHTRSASSQHCMTSHTRTGHTRRLDSTTGSRYDHVSL
ncbi:hypothetical protein DPMN_121902 [Dreissena polymorpha]|uniref:Uncharacterized protein n=1 Tax=Dreissena polymorpha TaxID=45954 RepID=A0A9D4JTL1_DREPO|nr:hypothetical protein DPMN_121902 [Dreissena polymorpha]